MGMRWERHVGNLSIDSQRQSKLDLLGGIVRIISVRARFAARVVTRLFGRIFDISSASHRRNASKTHQPCDMERGRCIEDRPAGLDNCE